MAISEYFRRLRARVGDELLLIPAVAVLLRNDAGELLLHRRPDGSWSLPAGAIEPGETPAQAAERETREETGLRVRATGVAGVFGGEPARTLYANGDRVEYTVTLLDCEVVGGSLQTQGDETVALRFFGAAEAREMLAFPYPIEALDRSGDAAYLQIEPSGGSGAYSDR